MDKKDLEKAFANNNGVLKTSQLRTNGLKTGVVKPHHGKTRVQGMYIFPIPCKQYIPSGYKEGVG